MRSRLQTLPKALAASCCLAIAMPAAPFTSRTASAAEEAAACGERIAALRSELRGSDASAGESANGSAAASGSADGSQPQYAGQTADKRGLLELDRAEAMADANPTTCWAIVRGVEQSIGQ